MLIDVTSFLNELDLTNSSELLQRTEKLLEDVNHLFSQESVELTEMSSLLEEKLQSFAEEVLGETVVTSFSSWNTRLQELLHHPSIVLSDVAQITEQFIEEIISTSLTTPTTINPTEISTLETVSNHTTMDSSNLEDDLAIFVTGTTDQEFSIDDPSFQKGWNDGLFSDIEEESGSLIGLNQFRSDSRFAGIDGTGYTVVILDTGIDLNHPFFGADTNGDGISDRIVYSYDFANNDADATDYNNHGSNVSSIIGGYYNSSTLKYSGVASNVNIIHLKVFTDSGSGSLSYVEKALQWVENNVSTYNIVSVNMSLGTNNNFSSSVSYYNISDELYRLATEDNVIVSASAGNNFYGFNSVMGVSYPAADPYTIGVGAVYDADSSYWYSYSSGAVAYSVEADQVTPFSQRHISEGSSVLETVTNSLTEIFAPGAPIVGASKDGGVVTMHGTSQAAPQIAGVVVLAQQLADQVLGRRLTFSEMETLLYSTGDTIYDGDDENDNVTNTNKSYKRVNVVKLGEAILAMGTPVNNTPVANNDSYTLNEDTTLTGNVLTNDGDVDGDALTAKLVSNVTQGSLTLNSNGSFSYTPNANYFGTDSFTYQTSDGKGGYSNATVSLTISPVNDHPVANNDSYTLNEDTTLTGNVLTNDGDVDGDALTAKLVSNVTQGSLTLNSNGSFSYTPNANYFGTDSFTYQTSDGKGGYSNATVSLTISPVNDHPVANNDSYTLNEDTTLTGNVLTNDGDVDGDALTAKLVSNVTQGSLTLNSNGSFSYTPNANYFGTDSFTYQTTDGKGGYSNATVSLTISPVNDHPVANNDSYTLNEDTTLTGNVLTNDGDVDGDALTAKLVSNVTQGSLTLNSNGSFSYTPNANYFGTDSFTYQTTDGKGGYSNATVSLTINDTTPTPTPSQLIINGQGYTVQSYDVANDQGFYSINPNNELTLFGNSWKSINLNTTITSNTVITLEFKSDSKGEVQGIGFDNDNFMNNSSGTSFQFAGIQQWGISKYGNYNIGSGWKQYSIPVGKFFTGSFKYLTFINDDDRKNPLGVSEFRNITISETTLNSNDQITGNSTTGINNNRVDYLVGKNGKDSWILGTKTELFYDKNGVQDYAVIQDFNSDNDTIQLKGSSADYLIGQVANLGTGIFYTGSSQDELIAVVQGNSNLNLNQKEFVYV